jgi:hypothetical protein
MRTSKSSAAILGLPALVFSAGAAIAAGQDPAPAQPNPETPPTSSTPMTPPQPEPATAEAATGAIASVQAKFDALDTNHDGFIDQSEAMASDVLAGQFATLDASGDHKLSLAEFTAASNLASIRIDHRKRQE